MLRRWMWRPGLWEQPFAQFKLMALALALVLQDEALRGYAQRAA
jgi:hypothetical protein